MRGNGPSRSRGPGACALGSAGVGMGLGVLGCTRALRADGGEALAWLVAPCARLAGLSLGSRADFAGSAPVGRALAWLIPAWEARGGSKADPVLWAWAGGRAGSQAWDPESDPGAAPLGLVLLPQSSCVSSSLRQGYWGWGFPCGRPIACLTPLGSFCTMSGPLFNYEL